MTTTIPREWLRRTGTPEQFEREQLERAAMAFNLPVEKVVQKLDGLAFGDLNGRWQDFVKRLAKDDELWFFSSPSHTFAKKLGCQGYAIVRDGVICDTFVTLRT
jgi:hypothetical protein